MNKHLKYFPRIKKYMMGFEIVKISDINQLTQEFSNIIHYNIIYYNRSEGVIYMIYSVQRL